MQRGGRSSRNLSSLWETKVSLFLVFPDMTNTDEIKKTYSVGYREASGIILAKRLQP